MKTLLLSESYDIMRFISLRKLIKLVVKGKVDVISSWESEINWVEGSMLHPSIIRMKYRVPIKRGAHPFKRKAVFNRDLHICQYCYKKLTPSKLTIDHIFPQSKGGKSSWTNCVTCCNDCNSEKANKTLEEVGFKLLSQPKPPIQPVVNEYRLMGDKHDDWGFYFGD